MLADFKGKVLICVGINDSTHATMPYNLRPNEHNVLVNAQDFDGTFKLLDDTLSKERFRIILSNQIIMNSVKYANYEI